MAELGRYRSNQEQEYFQKREKYLVENTNVTNQFLADCPFMFSNRFTITKMLTRLKLFEMVRDVSGSIVECGVGNGDSLMLYAHLSSILEPYSCTRKIVGFDTFEDGFVGVDEDLDPGIKEGDLSTSYNLLKDAVDLYDMNRAMGHINKIDIVKGDASKTIPDYIDQHKELTVALLYMDFDIYKPTKNGLEDLIPLVCKGGVVAFDELNYEKFPGETQALKEVLQINDLSLRRFYFSPFVSYFIKE